LSLVSAGQHAKIPLRGRRAECEVLGQLLDDVRTGHSRALVLRGEAGVGKSALLEFLAAGGADCRVVRTVGVESEMELPFAGLHQLCAPMLDRLDHLPGPQADALGTAFGLVAGPAADRFLVGLAVLSLLSDAAEERPLICLIDDTQWLDHVSAQVIAFVARRLMAESVALVFAAREPGDVAALDGLPQLMIGGLVNGDARALLESAIPWRLDERVRDRILAETRGNPLALLELPRGLTAAQLAGGFALPATGPLASQIEQSFVRRVQSLPADTQTLLLAAAADPLGDGALLRRAAAQLGIEAAAETAAEAAELVEFGAGVRFRHPLVRSAAYRSGTAGDRRRVHRALADSTDAESDPDRRVWHRAHAAEGPDDALADDLERSADRAQRRGGFAAAAAFLERASRLTSDRERRSARALAAAHAKFEAGAHDEVEALLAEAEIGPLSELQKARIARLRALIVFARRRGSDAPPLLLNAARGLETLDTELARETYLEALGAAVFAGRSGTQPDIREIAAAARRMSIGPGDPSPTDLLLDAVATRFTDGYESSASLARKTLRAFRDQAQQLSEKDLQWMWLAWLLAGDLWDDETWERLATRAVQLARESGALAVLPLALNYRASVHVHAGEFAAAATLIDESDSIIKATGNARPWYASQLLVAWSGKEPDASDQLAAGLATASTYGEGRVISQAAYFTATLCNGLGRYQDALTAARRACDHDDLCVFGFALVELIEAASRSAADDIAAAALVQLEARTVYAGTDWALGVLALCRALLSHGPDAESLYLEAIDRLERSRIVVHLSRARLLYGEWLRREGRRLDAREPLRVSYEVFDRIGAGAFAERARRELNASGETARQRTDATRFALTPQEAQIAELAAQGRTNPEIGSELFISSRTVEWHLKKVFTKLGISSRRDLRGTLSTLTQPSPM
jgi:DNA-binding CsgD family transcriptional regulator